MSRARVLVACNSIGLNVVVFSFMCMEQLSSKLLLLWSDGYEKVSYKLGYKLSAQFLNYDWLMVALTTIDHS